MLYTVHKRDLTAVPKTSQLIDWKSFWWCLKWQFILCHKVVLNSQFCKFVCVIEIAIDEAHVPRPNPADPMPWFRRYICSLWLFDTKYGHLMSGLRVCVAAGMAGQRNSVGNRSVGGASRVQAQRTQAPCGFRLKRLSEGTRLHLKLYLPDRYSPERFALTQCHIACKTYYFTEQNKLNVIIVAYKAHQTVDILVRRKHARFMSTLVDSRTKKGKYMATQPIYAAKAKQQTSFKGANADRYIRRYYFDQRRCLRRANARGFRPERPLKLWN